LERGGEAREAIAILVEEAQRILLKKKNPASPSQPLKV
jgi:hypothetical protein